MGMSGNMMGLGMLPGATMQQAGGQLNAEAQKYINEAMQRQSFGQQNPWDQISRYQGVVQPIGGMGSLGTSPNPYQGNMLAGALGGGLAGYGLYDQFGGGNSNSGNLLFGNTAGGGPGYAPPNNLWNQVGY